jgi:hypothetical protein
MLSLSNHHSEHDHSDGTWINLQRGQSLWGFSRENSLVYFSQISLDTKNFL